MNATELLADVKRKAQITSDNGSLSDADILDLATKELQTVIAPKILSVREKYFAVYTDFTISSTREYRIPPEAIGNKLIQIEIIDSAGSSRDLDLVSNSDHTLREAFYIRNSTIVLTDAVVTAGTLRMHYNARPGRLTTSASFVQTYNVNTSVLNVANAFVGSELNDKIRFQKGTSPYEDILPNVDFTILLNPDTTAMTIDPLQATSPFTRGDYATFIDLTEPHSNVKKSFYPQIPEELHDWLSYRTAMRVLEHLGHTELLQLKQQKLADMEKDMLALITPRVDASPKIVSGGELLGMDRY